MKQIKIRYVQKKELFPAFGYATENTQTVRIRKDLPKPFQKFVLAHELYHLKDWANQEKKGEDHHWLWEEIKANFYATLRHPIGALVGVGWRLRPSRIKFEIKRVYEWISK